MTLLLLWLATVSPGACLPIEHEHILGRDLARANAAFAGLPADLDFGVAPLVGSSRVFSAREFERIATTHGIQAEFSGEVCFSWPTKPLTSEAIADAMTKALLPRRVHVDVVDQSSWPVPAGNLIFPVSSLSFGADGVVLWRGYVNYGSTRRFSIWARARVQVQENHLFAAEKIQAGETFSPANVLTEAYDGVLTRDEPLTNMEDLTGQIARFDIASGTLLTHSMGRVPHIVERGDELTVISEKGRARVEAQCIADESGGAGSVITVHNARTGRRLRVLVEAKDKGVLASDDALGLTSGGPNQ
jgi:flagella basal body P-ring formation protein FlgA